MDFGKNGGTRGSIIYHGTGSGKTLVAGLIAMEYLTNPTRQGGPPPYVFIVSTKGNVSQLKNGIKAELTRFAGAQLYELTRRMGLRTTAAESGDHRRVLDVLFRDRILSYTEFASCLGRYGGGRNIESDGCKEVRANWKTRGLVLILDEMHEVVRKLDPKKLEKQTKGDDYGLQLMDTFLNENRGSPKLHVHGLTATLGSTLNEVQRLKNMAYLNTNRRPVQLSIANMSKNRTIFASQSQKDVRVPLSDLHWYVFLHKMSNLKKTFSPTFGAGNNRRNPYRDLFQGGKYVTVLNGLLNFMNYIPALKENQKIFNLLKNEEPTKYKYLELKNKSGSISKVLAGPKMLKLVENLRAPGKHFVYVNDTKSVMIVKKLLESILNYRDITKTYDTTNTNEKLSERRDGRVNFVWSVQDAPPLKMQMFMSGIDKNDKDRLTNALKRRNDRGQNCKVIISTKKAFQGVNINSLRYVHLLSPFPTRLKHRQASGRGARQGGHHFHAEDNRNYIDNFKKVTTLQYVAVRPRNLQIPQDRRTKVAVGHEFSVGIHDTLANGANHTRQRGGGNYMMTENTILAPSFDEIVLRHQTLNPSEQNLNAEIRRMKLLPGVIANPPNRR